MNPDGEFAYGAGQLNPIRALNPGLVYDMGEMSYIQFLCSEGYPGSSLQVLLGPGRTVNCSSLVPGLGYDSLNYPTMQLTLRNSGEPTIGVFVRTVTNVGPARSMYNATVRAPKGVKIVVKPTSLSFTRAMQKRSFKVAVEAEPALENRVVSGSLAWKSSSHVVRSPIVINGIRLDREAD